MEYSPIVQPQCVTRVAQNKLHRLRVTKCIMDTCHCRRREFIRWLEKDSIPSNTVGISVDRLLQEPQQMLAILKRPPRLNNCHTQSFSTHSLHYSQTVKYGSCHGFRAR